MIQPTNGTFAGAKPPALRLMQEIPGIADVVWSILARVDSACEPTRLLFTAAEQRAGNTVMAAATAISLARNLRVPVSLIETNVERPSLAGYLAMEGPGLSDVLDGRARVDDCLRSLPQCPQLSVLTAGAKRESISGEFSTDEMRSVLATAAAHARYVVIDAPPVLGHLESRLLLQHVDGAVLVLRANSTRTASAAKAQRILLESGAPLLGSVFNAHGATHARLRRPSEIVLPPASNERLLEARAELLEATAASAADGARQVEIGWNGARELPMPGVISEAEHNRQIDLLERRIAKLTKALEMTEAELRRIAAMKSIDLGVASIYRSVQGLSPEEECLALKKELMKQIFTANLDLRHTIERGPSGSGSSRAAQFDYPR